MKYYAISKNLVKLLADYDHNFPTTYKNDDLKI